MEKEKTYYRMRFSISTIKEAYEIFTSKYDLKKRPSILTIWHGNEKWGYDSLDEFFAEYSKAETYQFHYGEWVKDLYHRFTVHGTKDQTTVTVEQPNRGEVESVFQVFERDLEKSIIKVESAPIKIFIGHGHNEQWRDLKDHLHEQQGFDVIAYEIAPRAGLSIKEVLETMLNRSSIAFLVLTGEDVDNVGELHARENVIHELGLFQGRLGFKRAIILLEDGVKEFSNIVGINQIRFGKGNIRETYGDVVATIKREFEGKQ